MNKTLNTQTFCYIIFSIGIITSVALIIGALVAVAYMATLAMTALCQVATTISLLYQHADSFVQLLIICLLAFIFYKLVCLFIHSVRKEVQAW